MKAIFANTARASTQLIESVAVSSVLPGVYLLYEFTAFAALLKDDKLLAYYPLCFVLIGISEVFDNGYIFWVPFFSFPFLGFGLLGIGCVLLIRGKNRQRRQHLLNSDKET